jgi:hypothetical protein
VRAEQRPISVMTGHLRSSRWGTLIDLEPALEQAGGGSSCSVPPPDIYYNECLTAEARKALERRGYVIVYEQTGSSNGPSSSAAEAAGHTLSHQSAAGSPCSLLRHASHAAQRAAIVLNRAEPASSGVAHAP